MVIVLFDAAGAARDHNIYAWYFQIKVGKVLKATAFFDTREFDEFWARVSPTS